MNPTFKSALCCCVAAAAFSAGGSSDAEPLKVFILAGQSNMQGHATIDTFGYIGKDPETAPMLEAMTDGEGKPKISDRTWISYLSEARNLKPTLKHGKLTAGFGARDSTIGPEFTFGLYIEKLLDEPIMIIKTAWGGKNLHTDFRPPGAGPFPLTEQRLEQMKKQGKDIAAEKAAHEKATGHYYRLMIEHVNEVLADPEKIHPGYDPAEGFELAGFVWFQGWNDLVDSGVYPRRGQPGGYDAYSEVLAQFIRDVRADLEKPDLPFVIGVFGVGGQLDLKKDDRYKPINQSFRDAMAAPAGMPEFQNTVVNVLTEECWDPVQSVAEEKKWNTLAEIKRIKEGGRKLDRKEEQELFLKMMKEVSTPAEMDAYQGISNKSYHYLGSAKILGCIGKAFAEAMAPLVK